MIFRIYYTFFYLQVPNQYQPWKRNAGVYPFLNVQNLHLWVVNYFQRPRWQPHPPLLAKMIQLWMFVILAITKLLWKPWSKCPTITIHSELIFIFCENKVLKWHFLNWNHALFSHISGHSATPTTPIMSTKSHVIVAMDQPFLIFLWPPQPQPPN